MNPNANDHWNTNMNSYGLGTPINPFNGTADSQPMIPITLASPDQYTPYFSNFSLNSKTYYPNLHRDFRDNNHGPSASGSSNHNGRTSDNGWNTRTAHNTNSASITGSGSSSTGPAGGSETDGDGTRNGINNNRKFPSRRASTRGSKNSFPNPHVRHSTHPSQTFRKNNTRPQVTKGDGITHAEDLQPNEGFTGVKTTRAHQAVVPKVLSSSSNSSRGGRGMSQRGNWRGQHRGNVWKSRNHGGSSRHSAPLFPTSGSEELSESTPIPSTPHHVPSTALTKALNNNFVIPQKRKSPGLSDAASFPIDLSSGSGPSGRRGLDFSHLLPKAAGKHAKRQKTQELEQDPLQVDEALYEMEVADVQEENILSVPNHGNVSSPRLSSSAPKPTSNVTGNASLSPKSDSAVVLDDTAQTAAIACTTTTTATAVKDEPLNVEVPNSDCPPTASLTSGTKRYHPIPRSCLKLFSVPSANPSSSPTTISSSSSNGSQSAAQQVTPNPHWRTARAEFANRAINELRAEGLVVKRILWRMDGMCVDWEKPASAKANRDGDGTLKMKGKGKKRALTEGETENAMTMLMNDLITMDDIEPSQSLPQVIQNTSPQFPSNAKMEVNDLDEAMEIIDLTVDEKSSPPPPPYSYKFDDDEDDRPPFKPPLVVRLGSGRSSTSSASAGLSATTVRFSDSPSLSNSSTAEATSSPQSRADTEPRHKSRLHSLPPRPSYSHLHSSPLPPSRGTATSDDGEAVEINQSDDESSSSLRQESRDTDEEMQVLDDLEPGDGDKDLDGFNTEMEMNDLRGIVESRNIYENNRGASRVGAYEAGMDTEDSESVEYVEPADSNGIDFPTEQGLEGLDEHMHRLKMKGLAIEFLKAYVHSWEHDRRALANAYAPNAVFSCSVIFPPDATLDNSPTHAFASHFVASTSTHGSASASSSTRRSLRRLPISIQTPTAISPALLLLDPQRAYTFLPSGGQAQMKYDALYIGDVANPNSPTDHSRCRADLVYLGVQAELDRRLAQTPEDDILDIPKVPKRDEEDKVFVSWNFVLRAKFDGENGGNRRGGDGQDKEFPLQIVSHQMIVRDTP